MKKNLLHYGLQRSGTNFLETLLLKNFKINILNSNLDRSHPIQKHFRLYDEKHLMPDPQYNNNLTYRNFSEYLDSLGNIPNIEGVLVVSKDPYSWLTSYKKWGAKCNWPKVEHHYAEEYNLFYKKWIEFSKEDNRIIFVKYLDLLTSPTEELVKIEADLGLRKNLTTKIKGIQSSLKKVSHSSTFTSNRLEYYLNKEYLENYTPEQIDEINQKIEPEVFDALGYQVSTKK